MKNIILMIFALMMVACAAPQHTTPTPQNTSQATAQHTRNVIVYYDANVGAEPILTVAKAIHAEILYRYQNINALAVALPENYSPEQGIAYFEKIDGVLQVNRDQVMQLH